MNKLLILMFLIFLVLITTNMGDGKEYKQLHITSLTIKFDKTDATFIIDYEFGKISKFFLIMLGSQSLVPKIEDIFSNFNYEIVKVDDNEAILRVKNISRLDKGYYLHNSHKFSETIDTVYISDTSSTIVKEYHNINATPYYFYR